MSVAFSGTGRLATGDWRLVTGVIEQRLLGGTTLKNKLVWGVSSLFRLAVFMTREAERNRFDDLLTTEEEVRMYPVHPHRKANPRPRVAAYHN